MSASKILFNSKYNQDMFLNQINNHVLMHPNNSQQSLKDSIMAKSSIIFYPLDLDLIDRCLELSDRQPCEVLHIVWPHKWDMNMDPATFYRVLCQLEDDGYDFKVSILSKSFQDQPSATFEDMHKRFCKTKLLHLGFIEGPEDYYRVLRNADVVVSTAVLEYFGISVLEATYCGCIPVVPNGLSYPEVFQDKVQEMYNNEQELYQILAKLCDEKAHDTLNRNYRHLVEPFRAGNWHLNFLRAANYTPYHCAA